MTVDPHALSTPRVNRGYKDEIHGIPHELGFRSPGYGFDDPGVDADFVVGTIPFLSYASDEDPYQRQLVKVQKDQIDQSENPGDNSLSQWWMRTQTDWSGGAGQVYMEPIGTDGVGRRFAASAGVDVFTEPGQVRMLPSAVPVGTKMTGVGHVAKFAGGVIATAGTTVRTLPTGGTMVEHAAGGTIQRLTVAGGVALLSMDGKVQQMPVDGSSAPADVYTGAPAGVVPTCTFVKNRTIVTAGAKVWEVPGNPATPLDMAAATPVVDLRDPSWSWVGAASTPTAILLAGNGGAGSSIMSITIDPQSGNLPTLGGPAIVAEFPASEQILAITTYLGTYIAIATTAGIRVGQLRDTGLTYGPLLGAPLMSQPADVFTAWDRYVQYPVVDAGNGQGGLVRIDLSEFGQDGRAPWATFTRIPDAVAVDDGVVTGARESWMIGGGQLYHCVDGNPLDSGWLETSLVRYGTLEAKNFAGVKVVLLPGNQGFLRTSMMIDGKIDNQVGMLTAGTGPEGTFRTGARKALTQMALRFDFAPDKVTTTAGPVLDAWSMKAVPAITNRGQQVLLPLLCFDFERGNRGVNIGYEGRAKERWDDLIATINAGVTLRIHELHSGFTYNAIVEDCSFRQVAPGDMASGFGGFISLLLREVE